MPSLSTTPLGGSTPSQTSTMSNTSAFAQYKQQLNSYAEMREYLLTFSSKFSITTPNSVNLQASALTQLTQATNQLTRTSSVCALKLFFLE